MSQTQSVINKYIETHAEKLAAGLKDQKYYCYGSVSDLTEEEFARASNAFENAITSGGVKSFDFNDSMS